jgi:import receptor subunit TOM70
LFSGQIYFLLQEYEKAREQYEITMKLAPNFVFARIQSAVALYRANGKDEALKVFANLLQEFPTSSDVRYYYGEILLDQQNLIEANKQFEAATSIDPKLALPHLNRGIIAYHFQQDKDEALKHTLKAIEVDNRCELAYLHLAQMYSASGMFTEAILTYKRAIDLSRSVQDAYTAIMGLEVIVLSELQIFKLILFLQIVNAFANGCL